MKTKKKDNESHPLDTTVKNTETDLVKFAKKFMTFKITPLQEGCIKVLMAQKGEIIFPNYRQSYSKKNELTNYALGKMKVNQTFALASPDGIRLFKMVDFKPATLSNDVLERF